MKSETTGAETFSERLRRLREARNLSLDNLAAKAELSKAYVWRLETSPKPNPSVAVALKLAAALGVGIAELVEPPAQPAPIEGAENIAVPAFSGIIEALEWIRTQPEEVQRSINRQLILAGLRESFERKLTTVVDELFAGLWK